MIDGISIKAETEELLVQVEKNIENLRQTDQNVVNANFKDLIKWQELYFI